MARRYVICPVVGSGTREDPYRAAVAGLSGVNVSAMIPTGPDGRPLYRYCLCLIAFRDLGQVQTTPDTYVLPDFPLDAAMNAMSSGTRQGMGSRLRAIDLNGAGRRLDVDFYSPSDSWRDVVNGLGQQIEPVFDAERFGVAEV